MKIVVIHGQNHKETSYHMGKLFVEQFPDAEKREFFLPKDLIAFCMGCFNCLHRGLSACPHVSQTERITQHMLEADLLVFTTPVYCFHISAGLKNFFEHYFTWYMVHRPEEWMFSKKAVILSCGAGAGMRTVNKATQKILSQWGISQILSFGFASGSTIWNKVDHQRKVKLEDNLQQLAKKVKTTNTSTSLTCKILFHLMRKMHQNRYGSPEDRDYWESKGWLEKNRPWSPLPKV